jgi:hypothetical protein
MIPGPMLLIVLGLVGFWAMFSLISILSVMKRLSIGGNFINLNIFINNAGI